MGMYTFKQLLQQESLKALNSVTTTKLGQITGYDPEKLAVTVLLYPEDTATNTPALQTGWIPLFTPWTGPGWGIFAPPNLGDIVEVHFQDGSLQNGYAGLRNAALGNSYPNVPSGEFWVVHQSGSMLQFKNDGSVTVTSKTIVNVTAPTVNLSGTVSMGNLTQALTPLMNSVAQSVYNTHTHNVSGSVTLAPNQLIPNSALTSNVKGN